MAPGKIVFLAVNASHSHTMLSAACVQAAALGAIPQCHWETLESTTNDDPQRLAIKLASARPDTVMATAYVFNVRFLLSVLTRLKTIHPQSRVYLGGPEFLGDNESFLRENPFVNAVIRGDESSIPDLLLNRDTVTGLCEIAADGTYRDQGTACHHGDPDAIPSPYLLGLFPKNKPFLQVECSRGCSGSCSFCSSGTSHQPPLLFSVERIKAELEAIRNAGIREVRVIDRTFNANQERAMELLGLFRDHFPELRFHLEVNPAMLSQALLEQLAGFPRGQLHLEAGIQTLNPLSLKAIRRPASPERSLGGLHGLTRLRNIEVHADLIAGLPHQSLDDVFNDVRSLAAAEPDEIQLETLKLLPGTALAGNPPPGMLHAPEPPREVLATASMTPSELLQTRYLSQLSDAYYNHPPLRGLFRFCVIADNNFLPSFTAFVSGNFDPLVKPAPGTRLDLLESFARGHGDLRLAELVRFTWLAMGLSPEAKAIRVSKFFATECAKDCQTLFDSGLPAKRFFTADFSFDADALLLRDRPLEFPQIPSRYRFELLHGQKIAAIRRLSLP